MSRTRFTVLGAIVLFCLVFASACDRPELSLGEMCTLNTDCPEPLACRLERCRRQCVVSRDCGAGLQCLRLPEDIGGFCQLPEETGCTLTSQCLGVLVCRFGSCTTECLENRDCVEGAMCLDDPEVGGLACTEPIQELCIYNSDCPEDFICDEEQRCRFECLEARDCRDPRVCNLTTHLCELPPL